MQTGIHRSDMHPDILTDMHKRDMHQSDMHPDILTDMHLHIHINMHKSGILINMQKSE